MMLSLSAAAFAPSSFSGAARVVSTKSVRPNSQLRMIFGGPKDDGKPGDYVCLVRSNAME
jgi:hypothetical protein